MLNEFCATCGAHATRVLVLYDVGRRALCGPCADVAIALTLVTPARRTRRRRGR